MERLQKVIAKSNVASRRQAEKLITDGKVSVNGEVVTKLGTKVSEDDEIRVNGKLIKEAKKIYLLLNKPTGYISTTDDDKNRRIVLDLIEEEYENKRLYPVGRLDYDTAGILLLTNDGDLTQILTRPEFDVEKEYIVRVEGIIVRKKLNDFKKGVIIDNDYLAKAKDVNIIEIDKKNQSTLLGVVLTEGKNRQIRKMFEAINHPVKTLTRVRYDFLTLEGVKRGGFRELKVHEVRKLYSNKYKK